MGEIGTTAAATVVTRMLSTFPSIRFGLMVGSKPTIKFCGYIFGPGISGNATKDRAISTAGYALQKELHQTPTHVWMAFFTGASWTKTASPSGAYSVVFPSPNSTDHHKLAKMAWYMASSSEVVNEKRLSGLAVAQALHIADERLRALPNNKERPKKATIKVFVYCVETLKNIDDPGSIGGDGREAQLEMVKLIEDLSYSLCNIAGINVRLYLQWVPADYGKMVCTRDFAKRCRRKKGRKDLYYVGNDVRDAGLMPEGVSGFIERDTVEESQQSTMEESGGSVPMAEEGPASMAEVVLEELPVEVPSPIDGRAGVDQEEMPMDEKDAVEEQTTTSEQVPNDGLVTNDEQASLNQQILADCYQQQIQFLGEQGNQDVANQ
ncbi:hypothetical protein B0H65DRAFT_512012 [Neurospora tetraspora]|uniref:Uncharacterized protein n=1 Tax=Neurospora tetraspora TaxID=94610 RepID=A0AAE0MMM3_9PEZI|nr:hypothetical protein B0H65DRAFT_512012 [Neurospora tetraspora]